MLPQLMHKEADLYRGSVDYSLSPARLKRLDQNENIAQRRD